MRIPVFTRQSRGHSEVVWFEQVLAERRVKELKQEEGLLSEELVEFSQQMMRFGLPLHLVCLFVTRSAGRHGMSAERTNHLIEKLTLY